MNPRVLRRFVIIAGIATLAMFTLWAVLQEVFVSAPGDYEVRKGDILLSERKYDEAIGWFDKALTIAPNHRGALMGRAVAFLQSDRPVEAEAEFGYLIDYLTRTLAADDPTGRGVLAGAYANRGILHDRNGRYQQALADYRRALAVDAGAVEGPDIFHKILYGHARPSTIAKRAAYLEQQLALPEEQRVLRIPEIDARQRMYKP
jgi:tetratricopeptide (TPR) repeat protein